MLRARGARIALDDAGNGYAGLQQIIRIAPDILKLDRSLVDGVHDDPHRFALLEALISFAVDDRARRSAPRASRRSTTSPCSPRLDVTYAQGWALARPDAPWAALAPQAAAAASAEVRIGMRVAREPHDDGRADARRPDRAGSPRVSCAEDIRRRRGADPRGARRRRRRGLARRAGRGLRRGHQPPRLVAARRALLRCADYPATEYVLRTRTAGQVVAGDPASDPAEVALLERNGFQARADGPARVRRPRRRPARALPPPRDAVEQRRDRARAAARAPARRRDRPARAHGRPRAAERARPRRAPDLRRDGDPRRRAARVPGRRAPVHVVVPHGDGRRVRGAARVRGPARAAARWFQRDHYDLPPHGRAAAVAHGRRGGDHGRAAAAHDRPARRPRAAARARARRA